MINLDELDYLILGDVRQRMGADNEKDTAFDDEIRQMTPDQIAEKWCGWNLGDESWARTILSIVRDAEEAEEKP